MQFFTFYSVYCNLKLFYSIYIVYNLLAILTCMLHKINFKCITFANVMNKSQINFKIPEESENILSPRIFVKYLHEALR